MAQQEEMPDLRILPPTRRPVLPTEEGYVPPVRATNAGKRSAPGHTIAVNSDAYALLLHEKHAMEVERRGLVSFGDVIQGLIEARERLRMLEAKIEARRTAKLAAAAEEAE